MIRRAYHEGADESGKEITDGYGKDEGPDTKDDKKGTTDRVKKK